MTFTQRKRSEMARCWHVSFSHEPWWRQTGTNSKETQKDGRLIWAYGAYFHVSSRRHTHTNTLRPTALTQWWFFLDMMMILDIWTWGILRSGGHCKLFVTALWLGLTIFLCVCVCVCCGNVIRVRWYHIVFPAKYATVASCYIHTIHFNWNRF